jgi:hypothetical protein
VESGGLVGRLVGRGLLEGREGAETRGKGFTCKRHLYTSQGNLLCRYLLLMMIVFSSCLFYSIGICNQFWYSILLHYYNEAYVYDYYICQMRYYCMRIYVTLRNRNNFNLYIHFRSSRSSCTSSPLFSPQCAVTLRRLCSIQLKPHHPPRPSLPIAAWNGLTCVIPFSFSLLCMFLTF